MSVQLQFDANQVAPQQAFQPLEDGWYRMQITESEFKPTQDAATTGNAYLQMTLKVVGGKYNNRTTWARLNLQNTNETAVEIAYAELSAICHATGVMLMQDTGQLHGIPMLVKIKKTAKTEKYDEGNEIKGYKHLNELPTLGMALMGEGGEAAGEGFGTMQQQQAPQQGFAPQQQQQQPVQQQQQQQAVQQQQQQFQPQQGQAEQPVQQQTAPQQEQQQQQQPWNNGGAQQPWDNNQQQQEPVQQQQQQQAEQPAQQQQQQVVNNNVQQDPAPQQQQQQAAAGQPPWAQ